MIFTSLQFLLFLVAVLIVFLITPTKYRWIILLAASYYFYGHRNPLHSLYLVIPTVTIYVIGLNIGRSQSPILRKRWFLLGIFFGVSSLAVFKYADFIGQNLYSLVGLWSHNLTYTPLNLILPLGISFFSFKLISYVIDVYRGNAEPEKHLGHFALYVAFFPQLLAGPIDRAVKLIPQLKGKYNVTVDNFVSGCRLVVWGIFKKVVIADRLSIFIGEVFKDPQDQGFKLVLVAYFYAFQIYCDFSGYSDMAIGIARILGIHSIINFNFPYFSKSLADFWSRWHISLSTWLRDYLFLPIAYSVMRPIKTPLWHKVKAETWGYITGMTLTMLIGGLWHGANWTFVIWGFLHGIYLLIGYLTKKIRKNAIKRIGLNRFPRLRHFISIFITFNLVSFAWIFFRAESFDKAFHYINRITLKMSAQGIGYILFNVILILVFIGLEYLYKNRSQFHFLQTMSPYIKTFIFAVFICLIIIFSVDQSNEFIYFQF